MNMDMLKPLLTLLMVVLLQSCGSPPTWNGTDVTGVMPDLEFTLTDTNGSNVDAASLRGKPLLVFFGFTNCPHVCPTTLTRLSVVMKELGPQADYIRVAFVSVDPARDTPEVMKKYTTSFGPWLMGFTGSEQSITKLRESYGVYAAMESSDDQGTYNVMHSTAVFAFDARGRARLVISDVHNTAAVVADLKQLIKQ